MSVFHPSINKIQLLFEHDTAYGWNRTTRVWESYSFGREVEYDVYTEATTVKKDKTRITSIYNPVWGLEVIQEYRLGVINESATVLYDFHTFNGSKAQVTYYNITVEVTTLDFYTNFLNYMKKGDKHVVMPGAN